MSALIIFVYNEPLFTLGTREFSLSPTFSLPLPITFEYTM